jgi:hypothetical protein
MYIYEIKTVTLKTHWESLDKNHLDQRFSLLIIMTKSVDLLRRNKIIILEI